MIQTRSEISGIEDHPTIKRAMETAEEDRTIWKVSFDATTGERVRLVRREIEGQQVWSYEPMDQALEISMKEAREL